MVAVCEFVACQRAGSAGIYFRVYVYALILEGTGAAVCGPWIRRLRLHAVRPRRPWMAGRGRNQVPGGVEARCHRGAATLHPNRWAACPKKGLAAVVVLVFCIVCCYCCFFCLVALFSLLLFLFELVVVLCEFCWSTIAVSTAFNVELLSKRCWSTASESTTMVSRCRFFLLDCLCLFREVACRESANASSMTVCVARRAVACVDLCG